MVTDSDVLAPEPLPAASTALAVSAWVPLASVLLVMLHTPRLLAVPVPRMVVPSVSNSVTVLLASAVPVMIGVPRFVIPSPGTPVSLDVARARPVGAVGAAVSIVTLFATLADDTLPTASTALAVTV